MFCKKCGKLISDEDKFCSNCGEKAEQSLNEGFHQEILKAPQSPEKSKRQYHMEEFNWNLDGYPTDHTKPTEDINFNWESVVEEKQRRIYADSLAPEVESEPDPVMEATPEPVEEKTLEEEIFGDFSTTYSDEPTKVIEKAETEKGQPVDKFYTFNKKNEALQALLDQEYEKIKSGDEEEEPFEPMFKVEAVEVDTQLEEADTEPEEELQFVAVALSETPESVILPEEIEPVKEEVEAPEQPVVDEFPSEAEEECPPSDQNQETEEKGTYTKLTFDDVFSNDDDDDEEEEKPQKKSKVLKIIAIILCVLIVAELAIIGIMYFGKGTPLAEKLNDSYLYIVNLVSKDEPKADPQMAVESDVEKAIKTQSMYNKNIGTVEENRDLTFDMKKDYGIDELSDTNTFSDKSWYTDDDNVEVSYGDEIIGTLIKYHSSWVDMANDIDEVVLDYVDDTADIYEELENFQSSDGVKYGINKLEIGEIRNGSRGFYIMIAVAKVDSDTNKETVENRIIYMEPIEKTMKILNIYKF